LPVRRRNGAERPVRSQNEIVCVEQCSESLERRDLDMAVSFHGNGVAAVVEAACVSPPNARCFVANDRYLIKPTQQGRSVVSVTSSAGDARLGLVDEAVSFWNKTLQELGVCYSLGPVTRLVQSVPEEALQSVGQLLEGGRGPSKIPPVLLDQSGDITIFLAESEFLSFAVGPLGPDRKEVLGARNVITHLLGIALGLRHNSDPTTLMCGRPARCRPALFRSVTPRVFPLTDTERRQLRAMYPSCVA
jgi:hypothetical protein